MKVTGQALLLGSAAICLVLAAVWGPEAVSRYQDKAVLGKIHRQEGNGGTEGYRYTLNSNEKLYLLSKCLNDQNLAENEQSAWMWEDADGYEKTEGSFAFIRNRKEDAGEQIGREALFDVCNEQLEELKKQDILPAYIEAVGPDKYEAVLYSAIDVLEPGNHVAIWKLNMAEDQKNADKNNRVMDVYMDADDGRIYEFYVRTSMQWEEIDTDAMIGQYGEYLGLGKPTVHETDNPLAEMTPYYQKYEFAGMGGENTVVTVGFYEGINELFIKVTR